MRWLAYWFAWLTIRLVSWVLFGYKVMGTENIPRQGAFIYAVNHQSYIDPPMIGVAPRRVMHYFAKKELFDNFLFGALISYFNAMPVRRGVYDPQSLSRALGVLNKGGGLMFFPEGTRGDGVNFLPAKRGIGMIAKRAGVPIIPAYAEGTNRLKKALLTRKRVKVLIGKPISPDEYAEFSDDREGYQGLAEKVMARIGELKLVMESGE